jgi:hypothetical protein
MGRTEAQVVDPRVARESTAEVNLHEVPGGHSLAQLNQALGVATDHDRTGDSLTVAVHLTNKGAGHAVPTGMPGRRVILRLEVRTGDGQSAEAERVYAKSFVDRDGQAVESGSDLFASGVRLQADTRIRADERRSEVFRFPVPAAATAVVSLKLFYEHAPTRDEGERTWVTFYSQNRTIPPAKASD